MTPFSYGECPLEKHHPIQNNNVKFATQATGLTALGLTVAASPEMAFPVELDQMAPTKEVLTLMEVNNLVPPTISVTRFGDNSPLWQKV